MVKSVLRKATPASGVPAQTHNQPVDENAADRLAAELESEAAPVAESSAAVVRSSPSTAVVGKASGYTAASDGGLEGGFDESDIKLPQLKIVNGSGELSKLHNQGTLLYADEVLFDVPSLKPGATNPSLLFVPIKIVKQFRENLTQEENEDGVMPRVVSSREEAEALGGSTRWIGQERPRWSPSAKCLLLIQEPEGSSHPGFTNTLDGKSYAPAVYYNSGMAYDAFAKQIFNAAQLSLKENGRIFLPKRVWTMQIVKGGKKFTVFVPSIKLLKEETGPELREFAQNLIGASPAATND